MTRRDLFNPNTARDAARERAAALKARVSLVDLARRRGANVEATPAGKYSPISRVEAGRTVEVGHVCDCPACHVVWSVRIADHGQGWCCRAGGCGAKGDLITFEMAATGRDFAGACAALEAAFPEGGDDGASGDLFGGDDV
ncbi:hypothetical protein [Maricaulis sp.]|uniref:hypothetical protein n=1 Tax=Maricaulis sp. TaxID=1486257 RepID=UPI003A9193B7